MRLLAALVMFALAAGCAMTATTRVKVDRTCAFAYFLPLPFSVLAVGACEFGPEDEPQEDLDV